MNKAHSVSARLLQIAKAREEDFHFILVRYGSERLLYRIGENPLLGTFLLKGASLFLVWEGTWFRTTRDIDLLGFGNPDMEHVKQCLRNSAKAASQFGAKRPGPLVV